MRQKNLKLHELPYIHRNYMNCRTVHTQKWQTPGLLASPQNGFNFGQMLRSYNSDWPLSIT